MNNISAQQNASVVAFRLDRRTFAMPLDVIVQILPMMTITPIPHLSKVVKGTINVRGKDILAISLRSHFGIEEIELQLYTPLLLLKLHDERSLALIVDSVLDVMTLPLERVTSLQNILPDGVENIPMLRGVSYHNDETILVLDPDQLFYNQQSVLQQHSVETKTRVEEDIPAAKRTPIVESAPLAENIPVLENALIEKDTPPALPPEHLPTEDEAS